MILANARSLTASAVGAAVLTALLTTAAVPTPAAAAHSAGEAVAPQPAPFPEDSITSTAEYEYEEGYEGVSTGAEEETVQEAEGLCFYEQDGDPTHFSRSNPGYATAVVDAM